MLSFGKYKGQSISDIYQRDQSYLEWLLDQPWFQSKFKEQHPIVSETLKDIRPVYETNSDTTIIYTDGACKHNGAKTSRRVRAGCGVHFSHQNKERFEDISTKFPLDNPTNNRAELYAIYLALKTCIDNDVTKDILIYTDSDYAMKCITAWYPQWVKQNDISNKKNIDLLQMIETLQTRVDVKYMHIRSHTGLSDPHSLGNERADYLATACLR